jgi:hypothetical protein
MKINNAALSAMPTQVNGGDLFGGLTKREQIAMVALQGILSSPYYADFCDQPNYDQKPKAAAISAIKHADALLEELDKTNDD